MIVASTGSSTVDAQSTTAAQITCIVAATGLAFSSRPVSKGRMIVRYVKRHIFFLKLWFAKRYQTVTLMPQFKSTKSGAVEINGPPVRDSDN